MLRYYRTSQVELSVPGNKCDKKHLIGACFTGSLSGFDWIVAQLSSQHLESNQSSTFTRQTSKISMKQQSKIWVDMHHMQKNKSKFYVYEVCGCWVQRTTPKA